MRFHNIFGPLGTFEGGREKSPAAFCRKIALASENDEIEVWGDGQQTRSYCYIDDCVEGIHRLMRSEHREPLNLGQDRLVSIEELVRIVAFIAGKSVKLRYDTSKPQGVRGRNSDNTRLRQVLGWVPTTSLERGLELTYRWIEATPARAGPAAGLRLAMDPRPRVLLVESLSGRQRLRRRCSCARSRSACSLTVVTVDDTRLEPVDCERLLPVLAALRRRAAAACASSCASCGARCASRGSSGAIAATRSTCSRFA